MDNGAASSFWESYGILIPTIIFILLSIFLRRRRGRKTNLEVVFGFLSDIKQNLKIVDTFSSNWQIKRSFKTGSWNKNRGKIDFLNQELQNHLSHAFNLAEDFNQRIVDAKQYKSTSYLAGIEVDKLIGPLTMSKEGLDEWLQTNSQTELLQR